MKEIDIDWHMCMNRGNPLQQLNLYINNIEASCFLAVYKKLEIPVDNQGLRFAGGTPRAFYKGDLLQDVEIYIYGDEEDEHAI